MATITTKLGLRKPAGADNVNVTTDISDNMDKIDAAFSGIVGAYKNVIRNGDMGVAQRGSGPFTGNVYGIDGFYNQKFGAAALSTTRVATTLGEIAGCKWWNNVVVSASAAAGDGMYISAPIEGVEKYAGQQVTLSFKAKASAGTPKIGVEISQDFGTGGAPSATVDTAISAITISTTATGYSATFTVPSITGKTLGTAGNDKFVVNLWLSAGTTFAARASNIGHQNVTISITDIQLELGSVATAFERLPQQMQLAWCQRYFQKTGLSASSGIPMATGLAVSTTIIRFTHPLLVEMRVTPTITISGNNYQVRYGGDATALVAALALHGIAGTKVVGLTATMGSAVLAVGQSGLLETGGSTGGIDVSAEL